MSADTSKSQAAEPKHAGTPPESSAEDPGDLPPPDAFKAAIGRLSELLEYARQYYAAQVDLLRLRLRRMIVLAALALVALLAGATLIVTLVVMACRGLSDLIAQALGGRVWAGELIVSVGTISILIVGCWLALRSMSRKSMKDAVNRYEQRRRQQRARFGKDAAERAREHHENR